MVGSRSDVRGWWDGRAGSITDGSYTLSDGSNGRIRQFMRSTTGVSIPSGRIRFLFNGNRAANLFPDRIIARNGANQVELTPPNPRATQSFGQGTGMDYTISSGDASLVFVNGATVTAEVYYN